MTFAAIPDVLAALKRGEQIVLVDDEDRENEGDLVVAAQHADPKAIAFMATKACGLICLAMEGRMLDRLGLPLMTSVNNSRFGTAFTLSIEARDGVTTGISAADRSRTVQVAIASEAKPQDIVTPGHVFPLRARDGGVLVRAGQTEGSVDLCRLASLTPAAVICEVMKPDGTMARLPDLQVFCREHGLLLASIADLIAWREARETLVELVAEGPVTTRHGLLHGYVYANVLSGEYHLALVVGDGIGPGLEVRDPVLVRVQQQAALADAFTGVPRRVDLHTCLERITAAGRGVLLMVHDTGGRSLPAQLVEIGGRDLRGPGRPVPGMDLRDYGIGAQILHHLGVRRMRLLTGSDRHLSGLSGHGLEVVERIRP